MTLIAHLSDLHLLAARRPDRHAPYAERSRPGSVTVLDDVAVMAISTAIPQPLTRARGAAGSEQLDRLSAVASSRWLGRRALVAALHHAPLPHPVPAVHWLEGLRDWRRLRALLEHCPHLFALHGHVHQRTERPVRAFGPAQVFSVPAACTSEAPLAFYRLADRHLQSVPD